MSVHFELNIDSYTVDEIEKLINLNQPYNGKDVLKSANTLRDQILLDSSIGVDKKKDVIDFIKQIVNKLNNHLSTEKHLQTSDVFESSSNIQILRKNDSDYPSSAAEKINARDNTKIKSLYAPDTMSKVISLDTTFRKNYHTTNSADVIWDLPTQIKNVVSMELVSLEIPNTYFQISKKNGNNHLYFKCTNSKLREYGLNQGLTYLPDTTMEGIITIPDGNYDLTQIEDEINLQFEKIALTNDKIPITPIEFTVDEKSNRCIFALANLVEDKMFSLDDSLLIRFDYPGESVKNSDGTDNWQQTKVDNKPIQMKLGWLLGFRFAQYTGKAKKSLGPVDNLQFNTVEYEIKTANFVNDTDNNSIVKKHIDYFSDPNRNPIWLTDAYRDRINVPNLLFKNTASGVSYDISFSQPFKLYPSDKIRLSLIGGAYTGFRDSDQDQDGTIKLRGYDLTTNDITISVIGIKGTDSMEFQTIKLSDLSNGIVATNSITPDTNGTHDYITREFDLSTLLNTHKGEEINLVFRITGSDNNTDYALAINKIEIMYDNSVTNRSLAANYVTSENILDINGVSFVSEGIYDSIGNQYLYVVVDDYNYNNSENVMAIYNESVNNSYILARITKTGWAPDIRGDLWDVNSISNDISSKARKYFGPVDIQKLHIKIVDKYGRVVDLNEMDFSMALKLEYLYE
tara:strand:+ start:8665 stop:10719 length:2055 start_codon:yes stop_codon:yes gene_type:complete